MAKNTSSENPAEQVGTSVTEKTRVPMTAPQRKLELPEIPGYRIYWFRGEPGRIQRALRAGYEFIKPEEVDVNNFDLGGDASLSGQGDLGDKVSVAAQDGVGDNGQFLRLYAMKIKIEYYNADQEKYEKDRIDPFVNALVGGRVSTGDGGEQPGDVQHRYRKPTTLPKMFTKKPADKITRT